MAEEKKTGGEEYEAQFLTTEHFVLQTARAGTIQEANGRATLFVSAVSSAAVALGFVAQGTHMGDDSCSLRSLCWHRFILSAV